MTARHVDALISERDAARRQRDEAQACAWKATDLAIRWQELFIEREHLTDDDYIRALSDLQDETQHHIATAPLYTLASSALYPRDTERAGEGEVPARSAKPRTLADEVADGLHDGPAI